MIVAAEIEEAMDLMENKLTWKDIAVAVKLSPGSLTNLKNGTEMRFPTLLEIAKFIYKNDYVSRFKNWCLSFDRPKNISYALEYLAVNRQINELNHLVEKINSERFDQKLKEWAKGYHLLLKYLRGEEPTGIINELRLFSPKSIEMRVLTLLTEVWCRYKISDFTTMSSLIEGVESTIMEIDDDFIRNSYTTRLNEALAYVNLYKFNNVKLARKYAEEIILSKCSATFTTNASYLLGMSFLFEDYEKCLGHVLRHRELLIESGRMKEVDIIDNSDIPFINNIWRKHLKQPETNDISEIAHYEATVGDKSIAVGLVDSSIEKSGLSGFKVYYKALATGDLSLFMQSMIIFINKKGDKFYANLPYQYLKDDPTYRPMADLLLSN